MSTAIILESFPVGARTGLERRRVYIFLTRQGFLFALLLIVMLLGAVNYVNSMAYLMTFLLASLFMVCMLHTYSTLRGLVVSTGDGEPVFAGEPARFPVLLDNRDGTDRPGVELRPVAARRRGGSPVPTARLGLALASGVAHRAFLEVHAAERGRLTLERLVIETRYPLGLFRAWSYLDGCTTVVYPRPAGHRRLPETRASRSENETGQGPGADDFAGYASYRPGDPIRRIDWRALAREQGLLVKRFSGAGGRRLILDYAVLPASLTLEARLSQLCLWVIEAERCGHDYGLRLPDSEIAPDHGAAHRHDCLLALALYGSVSGSKSP